MEPMNMDSRSVSPEPEDEVPEVVPEEVPAVVPEDVPEPVWDV